MKRLDILVLCAGLCLQTCEVQATKKRPKDVRGSKIPDVREQTAAIMGAAQAAQDQQQAQKNWWSQAAGRRTGSKRK